MEILYYYLRFYDAGSYYTNPYVNLYLSDYGRIVNNYDGHLSTYKESNTLYDGISSRPFAILPLETSVIYPAGVGLAREPYTGGNAPNKLNYELFPEDNTLSYTSSNKIPNSFKMVTKYPDPI